MGTEDGLDLLNRTNWNVQPLSPRRKRRRLAAGFIRHVAVRGRERPGLDRHEPGRRQPLESPQLGVRRPQAGLAWGKDVTAFADAPDNKVWIASLGGGLFRYDGDTGEATGIDSIVGRRNAVGDQRVMSLRQDRRGTLWIGTMMSGLEKLSPRRTA